MGAKATWETAGNPRHSPTSSRGGRLRDADRGTVAARGRTWASAQLIAGTDTADGKTIRRTVEPDLGQLAERTKPFHTWFLIHPTLLKCRVMPSRLPGGSTADMAVGSYSFFVVVETKVPL